MSIIQVGNNNFQIQNLWKFINKSKQCKERKKADKNYL